MALDVANSVILRHDDERRADRFEVLEQMESFPSAAMSFCAERALFGAIKPPKRDNAAMLIRLREAIDRYFRARVRGEDMPLLLADLLDALAETLRRATAPDGLDAATAHSALRLIAMPDEGRMKICRNCGWLFIDRSKNRSRAWCDMAVCGNRAKAIRHYRRKKEETRP